MRKINWGIIGLGNVANRFAGAFKFSNNAKLLGIASKNLNKLNTFREKYLLDEKYCFNNYEELIKCKDVDIIYIALPNSLHHKWILKCIDYNKKILVEKPATLNFKEISDVQNKLRDKKIFFTEGFMYFFHPQTFKILDLINKNTIGTLVSMESNIGSNILPSFNLFGIEIKKAIKKKKRLFNKELGGGVILDLGSYVVSFSTLIASMIANFNKVEIINKTKEIKKGIDIDSYAELKFDNGFKSTIRASFTKDLGNKSIITGNLGQIIIEDTWFASSSYITIAKDITKRVEINNGKNIYIHEIENISDCILQNKLKQNFPGIKIENIVINMKILEDWLR